MAELRIQDLPTLPDALDPADFFNVQRLGSTWANYRTSVSAITGLETIVYEEVFDVAALDPAVEILPDPGSTNVYLITSAWVRYTPGSSNPNQLIKVAGLWFDSNQAFSALLRSNSAGGIAQMYWEGATAVYGSDRNFRVQAVAVPGDTTPNGDGTLTIHIEYAVVAL